MKGGLRATEATVVEINDFDNLNYRSLKSMCLDGWGVLAIYRGKVPHKDDRRRQCWYLCLRMRGHARPVLEICQQSKQINAKEPNLEGLKTIYLTNKLTQ